MINKTFCTFAIVSLMFLMLIIPNFQAAENEYHQNSPLWKKGDKWDYQMMRSNDNNFSGYFTIYHSGYKSIKVKNETITCDVLTFSLYTQDGNQTIQGTGNYYYKFGTRELIKFEYNSTSFNYNASYESHINITPIFSPFFIYGIPVVGCPLNYSMIDVTVSQYNKIIAVVNIPLSYYTGLGSHSLNESSNTSVVQYSSSIKVLNSTAEYHSNILGDVPSFVLNEDVKTTNISSLKNGNIENDSFIPTIPAIGRLFVFSEEISLLPLEVEYQSSKPFKLILNNVSNIYNDNSTPTANNNTIIVKNKSSYTFTIDDFGFNDPNETLVKIRITQLPKNDLLKITGKKVVLDQEIMVSDIIDGNFKVIVGENNKYSDSFHFKVNNGISYSSEDYTIQITFNPSSNNPLPGFSIVILIMALIVCFLVLKYKNYGN